MNQVYVYKAYCDEYCYMEEEVHVFEEKRDAICRLKKDVEKYFGCNWDEIPEKAPYFDEDSELTPEKVAYVDGDVTYYWVITENPVIEHVITSGKELFDSVKADYDQHSVVLNGLFFNLPVDMTEAELIKTYCECQYAINGDIFVRDDGKERCFNTDPNFIRPGEYENRYVGNAYSFLCRFNDERIFKRYCEGRLTEEINFIF